MENINLKRGICAICNQPISPEWSNSPSLGSVCKEHFDRRSEVFKPENFDFEVVKPSIFFNPLIGAYKLQYDWSGTKVMVNGRVGTVGYVQGDACIVRYSVATTHRDEDWLKVGYFDFYRLYQEAGLADELPALEFTPPDLIRSELLPEPTLPFEIHYNREGGIHSVEIAHLWLPDKGLTPFHLIHQFCNMYVRTVGELEGSMSAEGGFETRGLEIRNLHNRVGICDYFDGQRSEVEKMYNQLIFKLWIEMCSILLRQPWEKEPLTTVSAIWAAYVKILALALNQMSPQFLTEVLGQTRHHDANPFSPRI